MSKTSSKPINLLLLVPISITTIIILLLTTFPSHKTTSTLHVHNHLQLETARRVCGGTLYPDLCVSTLSLLPDLHKRSMKDMLCHTINVTESNVIAAEADVQGLGHRRPGRVPLNVLQTRAVQDCMELLGYTMDDLRDTFDGVNKCQPTKRKYNELLSLLSAALTNQYTCLDGFAVGANRTVRKYIEPELMKIARHVSNSLVFLIKNQKSHGGRGAHEDEFEEETNRVSRTGGFPGWINKKDRHLIQTGNGTVADVVVAKDGTGNFTTITEAVAAARNKSDTRFIIYIKSGAYFENVEVDKKKTNIMFIGDGIGKTFIKGNRNVIDGWTTFRSAVLAVVGKGFIAKGITVENYAGAAKHQAVALRSGSDLSAFYQCSFVAYQDTLYTHSLRQFYRECDIYGTVDFIFGNAAVVFQNCNLYARVPLENQKNIYTAQGREDPNQNTGISILNCKVTAASDLAANKTAFKTYLGRPWKLYSRTVYMLSLIDDVVDPAGWLEWDGDFALSTLYYGEYKNRGLGANTSARVTWPGYRVINNSVEASKFTVANFIQGGIWLPTYGIPFFLNMTSDSLI